MLFQSTIFLKDYLPGKCYILLKPACSKLIVGCCTVWDQDFFLFSFIFYFSFHLTVCEIFCNFFFLFFLPQNFSFKSSITEKENCKKNTRNCFKRKLLIEKEFSQKEILEWKTKDLSNKLWFTIYKNVWKS